MKHACIDFSFVFFSVGKGRQWLAFFAVLIAFGYNTQSGAASVEANAAERPLQKIHQMRIDLDAQYRQLTEYSQADASKQRWRVLADRFIYSEKNQTIMAEHTQQAELLLQQHREQDAQKHVQQLENIYKNLTADFDLIGKTIEAEDRAEQTRKDSKMYFMMRVRSKLPPKTLKAYGLMELARQERDKGHFTEALNLWSQAEMMVRESFNDHISGMAAWREESTQQARAAEGDMRKKVEKILADYFVEIPEGTFFMGSKDGGIDEAPQHKVSVPSFRLGKTEVTFVLYDLCVASTRCFAVPVDQGWGRGDRPVTNVSYRDITQQFLPWLNAVTGNKYRLPTEAEWEYAARAGSKAEFTWGDNITCAMARFDGGGASVCNAREGKNRGTAPVMNYKPNALGLYDMHGNVWEWVEDCWNPTYEGAPTDGSAWLSGNCEVRVMRGGSWDYHKSGLRSANRYYFSQKVRRPNYGFRLAQDK